MGVFCYFFAILKQFRYLGFVAGHALFDYHSDWGAVIILHRQFVCTYLYPRDGTDNETDNRQANYFHGRSQLLASLFGFKRRKSINAPHTAIAGNQTNTNSDSKTSSPLPLKTRLKLRGDTSMACHGANIR